MVNGTKRRMLVIPETSPHFKAYRDDFVLCQKLPQYSTPGEGELCNFFGVFKYFIIINRIINIC